MNRLTAYIKRKCWTILNIIVFTIIPIITILMFHHVESVSVTINMNSGVFGESGRTIFISDSDMVRLLINELTYRDCSFALFYDEEEGDIIVRHLFFNEEYVEFDMKEGHFFTSKDFDQPTNDIVVGKNVLEKTINNNATGHIANIIDDSTVIGVIGYDQYTKFDDIIFKKMSSDVYKEGVYQIDFLKNGLSDREMENLLDSINCDAEKIQLLSTEKKYGEELFAKLIIGRWFLILEICCIICTVIFLSFRISAQRKENMVKRMVGARIIDIIADLLIESVLTISGPVAVSYLVCCIWYRRYLYFAGYMLAANIIITFIVLLIEVVELMKLPIREIVNE